LPVRKLLKSRIFLVAAVAAVVVGLYAWAGFRLAPGIIRDQAVEFVRENYHRELKVGAVRVQPFKLQLEIRDLAFPDADGQPMLWWRRFMIDFELSSLWHRAYVFREVILEAPGARVVVRPGGALNLADLALPPKTPPTPEEKTRPPSLWIQSLAVTDGRVDYADNARREPYGEQFRSIGFSLKDFRTTAEGGGFRLSARTEANTDVDWKGRFELEPQVASQGEFTVGSLQAARVGQFLGDALPFGLSAGTIDLGGEYRVALGEQLEVHLKLPKIALSNLALRARGASTDWVNIPGIELLNTAVDMPEQKVAIDALAISGLKAQAWTLPDGSINLTQLFSPPPAAGSPPAAAPAGATKPVAGAAPTTPPAPAKLWQLELANFDLKGANVDVEDRKQAPVKHFVVNPVNLHVQGASLDLAKPLPVKMDAIINGRALFKLTGTLAPDPLVGDLDVSLDKASMSYIQPYVLPVADLTIRDGTLATAGKLQLRPAGKREPGFGYSGQVTIDNFKSIDNSGKQDFVNFDRLQFQKLRLTAGPDALKVDRILLRGLYARVIVSREEILNISAVLNPQGAAAAKGEFEAKQARLASETPGQKKAREKQERAAKDKAEKLKKAQAKAAKSAPKPPVQAAGAPPPPEAFPIRIRELRIESGRMNFSDYSVPPDFNADIQDLKGTVTGLSSAIDSRAQVDLSGNLGEFSPVAIGGELQPFQFDRYTNIRLKFDNITLPIFNPYSGKYAGYSIANGKLFTEFHYLIENRKLNAGHKIRIEQLEWGAATAEKSEATLPVKFATWLLKDSNGNIDLDVPVTGSLDDPQFRIGPIVWKVIKNLIVKVVSAPFKFLGSLFKGAEEAQFIDFAPGSAEVAPQAAEHLSTLAKGLVQKPGIRLEVPAGIAAELDRAALVEQQFQQQLATELAQELRRKEDDATPLPRLESLPADRQVDVLTALVRRQTGQAPKIPEPPAPPEGTSRADAKAQRQAAAIEFLHKDAHSRLVATDAELDALGVARATAIQHALLANSGLDPARVFITKSGKINPTDGKVRFELALQ
jgi:hypothetical protein